jgi:hypothetical protein
MRYAVAIVLCLVLLVAGCAGSGGFTFKQVTYSLEGGIGGLDMEMTIQQDGTYQVAEKGKLGKPYSLSVSEFRTLKQLMASVDWPSLAPRYTDPTIADALFEGIVVKGAAKRDYTTVVGTGGTPPPALAALLARLQVMLKEHRPE